MTALFVYGSLRQGAGHPMHDVLRAAAVDRVQARVRGRLYVVDWYPGLVLDERAPWVVGEVWRGVDEGVWPKLDAYEACGPKDPTPHEYRRVRTQVVTAAASIEAWIYAFVLDSSELEVVASGDWLRR